MQAENEKQTAAMKRTPLWFKIVIGILAVALLVLLGFRLVSWHSHGQDSRLSVLVNPWNGVDNSGFTPHLTEVEGIQIDKSAKKPLEALLTACRQAGFTPELSAGYRSREEQQEVFDRTVRELLAGGDRSEDEATELAAMRVGRPGTSEHELGLAVDFAESGEGGLSAWLQENAWRYGFILRYPEGSEEITGRAADPKHYRFVGAATAEQIRAMDATLEEYQSLFYGDSAQIIFE